MTRTSSLRSDVVPISRLEVSAYRIPTDFPESDGTFEWDSTTLVLVELSAADVRGVGFTYADSSTATDLSRPGHGLELRRRDVARFALV